MIRTSIRWRLLAWLALLLGLMLVGFGVTAYQLNRISRLAQIDDELQRRVAALAQDVRGPGPGFGRGGPAAFGSIHTFGDRERRMPPTGVTNSVDEARPRLPPEPEHFEPNGKRASGEPPQEPPDWSMARQIRLSQDTLAMFDETNADGYFYAVWSRWGRETKRSANAPAGIARPGNHRSQQAGIKSFSSGGYRVAYYYTEFGSCALAGVSLAAYTEDLHQFLWWLSGAGALVLVVGLGGAWLIASRALRPVEEIGAAARRIAAGNLSERISTSDPESELGRLAGVLNSTFARLETAFAQQRQFTADASHEVRTPLTVIISEAQAALARQRTETEYRETLEVCLEAAQDMRRLADSLLELARIDAGQEPNRRVAMDLAEVAGACTSLVRPLAEARGISITTALEPAALQADPGRIRQVLINLLDNAIHYNYDNGSICVETRREKQNALLVVADTGRGIDPDDLPHVFERFYRADKSRTHTERRAGLGLAIVHSIVEAHGGTIEVSSQLGLGTTFTVRFSV